jgi:hypothetical protein
MGLAKDSKAGRRWGRRCSFPKRGVPRISPSQGGSRFILPPPSECLALENASIGNGIFAPRFVREPGMTIWEATTSLEIAPKNKG